ncbi:MAG: hypothetical protein Q4D48_01950 [Coriobacteriales bacterium]|nr:hypothetical protein [Coriobacteriales bacterium]
MAPRIDSSTRDERLAYVQKRFACIANCDLCGNCALFHGRSAEEALIDYIDGKEELPQVVMRYRR